MSYSLVLNSGHCQGHLFKVLPNLLLAASLTLNRLGFQTLVPADLTIHSHSLCRLSYHASITLSIYVRYSLSLWLVCFFHVEKLFDAVNGGLVITALYVKLHLFFGMFIQNKKRLQGRGVK